MADLDKFVKRSIKRRELSFYLLTEDEMSSLRSNTIAGDILFGLSSLCFGVALAEDIVTIAVFGAIFLIGSFFFYYQKASIIRKIKKEGEIEPATTNKSDSASIISAKYGVNDTWITITDRVQAAIKAGGQVMVTNGLAGQDPVPGIVKYLRVQYTVNGKKYSKDFKEDTPLELPAELY